MYEGPIPMPAGASHFKFAIINAAGVSGEVAEVNYSLSVGSRFSEADARGNILSAMLQMGEITDPEGTVRDGAGKLSYRFLAEQEIAGSGYFFLFEESITDAAGNLAVTWRRFAVSTATGTVYLMEEPTPGGYVLTPVG